jgi:hypothetical protein
MTQPIEKGISLKGIPYTKKTAILFDTARRSGRSDVLSKNDLLSYGINMTRYVNCGNDSSAQTAICQQRVRLWDNDLVRRRQYEPKDVLRMLQQFSKPDRSAIVDLAPLVMMNIGAFAARMRLTKGK